METNSLPLLSSGGGVTGTHGGRVAVSLGSLLSTCVVESKLIIFQFIVNMDMVS